MNIKLKLFIVATACVGSVAVYGFWANRQQSRLGSILGQVVSENFQALDDAAELKHAFVSYDDLTMRFMVTGESRILAEGERYKKTAGERIAHLRERSKSDAIQELLAELEKESAAYFSYVDIMASLYQKHKFPESGSIEMAAEWSRKFPKLKQAVGLLSSSGRQRLERINGICEKILYLNRLELEDASSYAGVLLKDGRKTALAAVILVLLVTGVITVGLAFSILKPLAALLTGVRQIVGGRLDLEMPVSSNDEVGTLTRAFNSMSRSLKDKQDQLLRETILDHSTGVYNFRYFQEVFERELERARRYKRSLSILVVDISHPPHSAVFPNKDGGLLKETAGALRKTLRAEDTLARYGENQLIMLLADTNKEQALAAVNRLQAAIAKTGSNGADKQTPAKAIVSFGGASFPLNAQSSKMLIERAERSLSQSHSPDQGIVAWA